MHAARKKGRCIGGHPPLGYDIDREQLAKTLSQFTELWDVLYPRERIDLVHSLIESVVYNDAAGGIDIPSASPHQPSLERADSTTFQRHRIQDFQMHFRGNLPTWEASAGAVGQEAAAGNIGRTSRLSR